MAYLDLSANGIGASYWTDGRIFGPMTSEFDGFISCPLCQKPLRKNNLDVIEILDDYGSKLAAPSPDCLQVAREVEPEELIQLIESGEISVEDVKYARTLAWRDLNDTRRFFYGDELHSIEQAAIEQRFPLSDLEEKNLDKLALLLNTGQIDDELLRAEALRQLGRFEDANFALQRVSQALESYAKLKATISTLVANMDRKLRKVSG